MKYPIGIQSFNQIVEEGFVYVDKTAMIYNLVKEGKIYFLGRPRRFGKSLLLSTLEHYFLGHKELFRGLAIDEMEKDWLEYPVFHLDFNGSNFTRQGALDAVLLDFVEEGERQYGLVPTTTELGLRFKKVLKAAHEKAGRRAVVLVDEYDKPLLDVMDTEIPSPFVAGNIKTLEDYNREVLKGFYSVFKLADAHLQFVFLTGVTKFSQISVFSGFNQPKDISLDGRYDTLCGITEAELLDVFKRPVSNLAAIYGVDEYKMIDMLKHQFDGYHFSDKMIGVFNPFSLLNTLDSQKITDYWFKTGTPTCLMRLMANSDETINELAGKYYSTSEFVDYKATKQKPLPMLYQSGYLTIKDCNMRRNTYMLDFPNEEVRIGTLSLLASDYFNGNGSSGEPTTWLGNVTDSLEEGNLDQFKLQLISLLSGISYRFQRKQDERECERHFHYTFYLIMQMLGKYNIYVEKETSQGRIDCVLECPNYVYIFEFKLNSTAKTALKQIEDKGYALPYASDSRKVYMVGINFLSEIGTINDFEYKVVIN